MGKKEREREDGPAQLVSPATATTTTTTTGGTMQAPIVCVGVGYKEISLPPAGLPVRVAGKVMYWPILFSIFIYRSLRIRI